MPAPNKPRPTPVRFLTAIREVRYFSPNSVSNSLEERWEESAKNTISEERRTVYRDNAREIAELKAPSNGLIIYFKRLSRSCRDIFSDNWK